MKKLSILFLLITSLFVLNSCDTDPSSKKDKKSKTEKKETKPEVSETENMIKELRLLVKNGDPKLYYHWNKRRAEMMKAQLNNVPEQQKMQIWFRYCSQLLYSGDSQGCINELESFLKRSGKPYRQIINEQNHILFELLALAYLRLGEQENCQLQHTSYSCIVPIQDPAIHQLKTGSENAIELYNWVTNLGRYLY